MKRSVLACALALACALSLAAPALAAEKAPSLAGDSKTTAVAKVYEYDPHRYLANGNSVYGNTLTVAADGGTLRGFGRRARGGQPPR